MMLYAIYAPENRERVRVGIAEEMARALKDGFTEAEVATAKRALLQARRIGRAQDGALANALAQQAYRGRTWDFTAKIDAGLEAVTVGERQRGAAQVPRPRRLRVVVRRRFQGEVTRGRRRKQPHHDVHQHEAGDDAAAAALTMSALSSSVQRLLKTFDDRCSETIFHSPAFLTIVDDHRESSVKMPRAIG